jgi:hypothetical protein
MFMLIPTYKFGKYHNNKKDEIILYQPTLIGVYIATKQNNLTFCRFWNAYTKVACNLHIGILHFGMWCTAHKVMEQLNLYPSNLDHTWHKDTQ